MIEDGRCALIGDGRYSLVGGRPLEGVLLYEVPSVGGYPL